MRRPGGLMMFVGDPNQAIMSFAGADAESYWAIRDETGAREMPLSICYRCPETHLALAREIVPQIEAAPGAPAGILRYGGEDTLVHEVREGDLVLCRRNAPLLKHCLRLIQSRRPARVRGRDVGKELANLVRDIGETAKDFRLFLKVLEEFEARSEERLVAQDASETLIDILHDKCEAVRTCYEGFAANDAEELAGQIEAIFSDVPDDNCIWLSSIHRSKGLENDRVFVLEYGRLGQGHPRQRPHELVQEVNLKYVALTRARKELVLLSEGGGPPLPDAPLLAGLAAGV
jgi:superfamily I DNA/RNA helicase